jgi:hypothetical protein
VTYGRRRNSKGFCVRTNPGEVGRRTAIVTQAAKAFGAVRVDPVEVKFDSITLLIGFDALEKAQALQEDCKKQPLSKVCRSATSAVQLELP